MNATVAPDLIFDIGMHKGEDAAFYLAKGFRVVALEANPAFTTAVAEWQAEAVAAGRLQVVQRALWHRDAEEVSFFINPAKDDWSSVLREWAVKDGSEAEEIRVQGLTLPAMFDAYGVPYYAKCDVEGADAFFTAQLLQDGRRPAFVSVEAISLEVLAELYAAGYRRFQLVNQALFFNVQPPQPPREGSFVPARFSGTMSGLFGRELPAEKWLTFSQAAERYLGFVRNYHVDPNLAFGWLDFHATTEEWLTA